MRKEELIKCGFTHRYKPALKIVDKNSLGYSLLFEAGNAISIELGYIESIKDWRVSYIMFTGQKAFEILKKDLKNNDLKSVVEFVKKYPRQTF